MTDCAKIRDFLNENDLFCRHCGIRLTEVSPGHAVGELTVEPHLVNSRGVVQGGAIFTLADFTFAGAANAMGSSTVSLDCSINFIRPGSGKKLIARADKVHHGRRTALYSVEVVNDEGTLIARMSITGCVISDQPIVGSADDGNTCAK